MSRKAEPEAPDLRGGTSHLGRPTLAGTSHLIGALAGTSHLSGAPHPGWDVPAPADQIQKDFNLFLWGGGAAGDVL